MAVPFGPIGPTITFTADAVAPAAVRAAASGSQQATKYTITNVGSVPAFIGWGGTAAAAGAAAVTPTATPTNAYPVVAGGQITISAAPNCFFTGTASAAAIVYVTPVEGG